MTVVPPRRKRTLAFDPRLLIGLLLVVGSVAGVVGLVSSADRTVPVLAAAEPLAPGDRVRAGDLEVRNVRLDAATRLYLGPDAIPAAGYVVTRSVSEGELVPVSAVGSVDGLRLASLVLDVGGTLASSIAPGSPVDIWAAREIENRRFGVPAVIVSGATVVRVVETQSIVGTGETVGIEVLVPKSRVARVLEALANSDAVSVVPASLPGR